MQSQETPGQAASFSSVTHNYTAWAGQRGEGRSCLWMMVADWDWMEPSNLRAPEWFAWPPVLGSWLRQAELPSWPGNKAPFRFESVLIIKIPAGVSSRES